MKNNSGKVREICQSYNVNVGTTALNIVTQTAYHPTKTNFSEIKHNRFHDIRTAI